MNSTCWKERAPFSRNNQNFADQKSDAEDSGPDRSNKNNLKVYKASCHCHRVRYQVVGPPEDAKRCHCRGCQKLHGAPFEWVCIFHKRNVRFIAGHDYLYFYSSELDRDWHASSDGNDDNADDRVLPVKVSCARCRTPIADEGRNMWLAFGTLFDFEDGGRVPDEFRHTCHLFYGQRCIDLNDDKPKWEGHKNRSVL